MIDRLFFVLGETFIGMRRNFFLGLAAITTSAIALYVLAGMAYVGRQTASYVETLQGQFEMTVNLKQGADAAAIARTAKYLRATPGVAKVVWIPRAKKWQKYQQTNPELTEGYDFADDIYPDQLRVTLNDLAKGDAVANKARRMSTVEKKGGVIYYAEAQNRVVKWIKVGKTLSYCLGGLLLLVSLIVIWHTVSLTLAARRTEVGIMRLVGASRIVIALPFMLEGALQGALGGALATGGLVATHHGVQTLLHGFSVQVSLSPFPTALALPALCAAGGGYGGLCSLVALRASLRARRNG